MKKYLFLFTISPVQSFIAQARKTQDLYAGSQIFSDLISYVAKDIFVDKFNGELIFPVYEAEQFTNRFLGVIDFQDDAEIKNIGEDLTKSLKEKWLEIAEKSLRDIINNDELPVGTYDQLNNLFEPKWAAVEWDGKDETYSDTYKKLERIIGGIKNLKEFSQYHYQKINGETIYGERGRKCSIDGERNVKFYRLTDRELMALTKSSDDCKKEIKRLLSKKLFLCDKDGDDFSYERKSSEVVIFSKSQWDDTEDTSLCYEKIVKEKVNDRYLASGEGLSAVSMVKRLYMQTVDFASTAEISLLSVFWKALHNAELLSDLFRLRSVFRLKGDEDYLVKALHISDRSEKKEFNYQWFYKENFKDAQKYLDDKRLKLLKSVIDKLKSEFGEFPKYYAIVVFDGDSMGEQLSKVENKDEHQKISEALSEFSKEVHKIDYTNDKDNLSRIVYSGGDDVLAFVNIEFLFDFLRKVRELYENKMSKVAEELNKDRNEGDKLKFTISAGVTIAHYKTPLGIVLSKAREMEKKAKFNENSTKNSFAIAVLKRSGEINETVWKWKIKEIQTVKVLKKLVCELQKEDGLSNTFIKSIQTEFNRLLDERGRLEIEIDMFKTELSRLLKKSRDKKMPDDNLKKIEDYLLNVLPDIKNNNFNYNNFFMALNIADFIHRNTNELKNKGNEKQ